MTTSVRPCPCGDPLCSPSDPRCPAELRLEADGWLTAYPSDTSPEVEASIEPDREPRERAYGTAPDPHPAAKASNPKDAIGAGKAALSLVPATALAYASLAHLNGAMKYGAWNWRKAGVRASIYLDAAMRHLLAWQDGEEADPEDGVPHLAAVLACVNILIDARACGKLTDDRPPSVGAAKVIRAAALEVKRLKDLHADRHPRHWTIADTE